MQRHVNCAKQRRTACASTYTSSATHTALRLCTRACGATFAASAVATAARSPPPLSPRPDSTCSDAAEP